MVELVTCISGPRCRAGAAWWAGAAGPWCGARARCRGGCLSRPPARSSPRPPGPSRRSRPRSAPATARWRDHWSWPGPSPRPTHLLVGVAGVVLPVVVAPVPDPVAAAHPRALREHALVRAADSSGGMTRVTQHTVTRDTWHLSVTTPSQEHLEPPQPCWSIMAALQGLLSPAQSVSRPPVYTCSPPVSLT